MSAVQECPYVQITWKCTLLKMEDRAKQTDRDRARQTETEVCVCVCGGGGQRERQTDRGSE